MNYYKGLIPAAQRWNVDKLKATWTTYRKTDPVIAAVCINEAILRATWQKMLPLWERP